MKWRCVWRMLTAQFADRSGTCSPAQMAAGVSTRNRAVGPVGDETQRIGAYRRADPWPACSERLQPVGGRPTILRMPEYRPVRGDLPLTPPGPGWTLWPDYRRRSSASLDVSSGVGRVVCPTWHVGIVHIKDRTAHLAAVLGGGVAGWPFGRVGLSAARLRRSARHRGSAASGPG